MEYEDKVEASDRKDSDGHGSAPERKSPPGVGPYQDTDGSEAGARPANGGPRRLLNARETIDYLGISLSTLNRIEKRGLLVPFRTPGGHRRYAQDMLDEYLENTRKPPAQAARGQSGSVPNNDG